MDEDDLTNKSLVPCRKWTSVYGSYFGAVEEVLADVRLAIAGVSVDERIRRGTLSPMRRCVQSCCVRIIVPAAAPF